MDLEALARPASRRVAVRVAPRALRAVRRGHPWVYADAVVAHSHDAPPGDLAVVFDDRRRFVAVGLWDPDSPIRVRVLHRGDPTAIDEQFWRRQIDVALAHRRSLTAGAPSAGVRLVNGENDGFGGLVVDRYARTAVAKVYTDAWWPHLGAVLSALRATETFDTVVVRTARRVTPTRGLVDGAVAVGDPASGPVRFSDNGLWFDADVRAGQKTGWFLDQRANRARVRDASADADVLDVFAAAGGFSVHAAAGGARSVTCVDVSAPALAAAARHLELNGGFGSSGRGWTTTIVGDAFAVMERLAAERRTYDIVVVDPPAFAQRADQVDRAVRAYRRLAGAALTMVRPGGLLVQASCSARIGIDSLRTAVGAAATASRTVLDEEWTSGHDIDHPVTFPEGAYLCAGAWRVGARTRRTTLGT